MLIDDVRDVEDLQLMVKKLWMILDDIEVADEMYKGDEKIYHNMIELAHNKRYRTGLSSDGYKLFFDKNDAK